VPGSLSAKGLSLDKLRDPRGARVRRVLRASSSWRAPGADGPPARDALCRAKSVGQLQQVVPDRQCQFRGTQGAGPPSKRMTRTKAAHADGASPLEDMRHRELQLLREEKAQNERTRLSWS